MVGGIKTKPKSFSLTSDQSIQKGDKSAGKFTPSPERFPHFESFAQQFHFCLGNLLFDRHLLNFTKFQGKDKEY